MSVLSTLSFKNFDDLCHILTNKPYNYMVKTSKNYPDLVLFSMAETTEKFVDCFASMIIDKTNHEVVSMPYKRMLSLDEVDDDDLKNGRMNEWYEKNVVTVEKACEGTFLRLFNYKDEWIVSSLRSINTRETYIIGTDKNFSDMFFDAWSGTLESLEKNKSYYFILQHKENKCIIQYNGDPKLLYIGWSDRDSLEYSYADSSESCFRQPNIYTIKKYGKFDLFSKFSDMLGEIYNKTELDIKGYILYLENGSRVMLPYEHFLYLQELRGTNPLIKIRYLELDKKKRKAFLEYYRDQGLNGIEEEMKTLINDILNTYKNVYVFKRDIHKNSGRFKKVIWELHREYLNNRKYISYEIVSNFIDGMSARDVGWLMKWF